MCNGFNEARLKFFEHRETKKLTLITLMLSEIQHNQCDEAVFYHLIIFIIM